MQLISANVFPLDANISGTDRGLIVGYQNRSIGCVREAVDGGTGATGG